MKQILVPCDFSEASVQAFRFAVSIAHQSGGEVNLLHVIELPALHNDAGISFEQSYLADIKQSAEVTFKRLIEKWAEGAIVKTYVQFGHLIKTVQETAAKIKADLVVVGTYGATGLKEYTIGSNTEKIVRTIDIPVIAVKKAPKVVKSIVFPTSLDLDQDLTMKVKQLQNFFKARIHVVFINTPALFIGDIKTKPALEDFAKQSMLENFSLNVYNATDAEQGIINFSREVKADLVAMRTHGRRGLAHLASGSIAEDVVNHIECATWTLRIE